jgi:hypothetical protein
MKVRLEQQDIFLAVTEYFARQGLVSESSAYEVGTDESGAVYIDVLGLNLVDRQAAAPPPPAKREKGRSSGVQDSDDPLQSKLRQVNRLALDPGDPPPSDDEDEDPLPFDRGENENLMRQGPRRAGNKRRFAKTEEYGDFDDMGKDPSDMRDEL